MLKKESRRDAIETTRTNARTILIVEWSVTLSRIVSISPIYSTPSIPAISQHLRRNIPRRTDWYMSPLPWWPTIYGGFLFCCRDEPERRRASRRGSATFSRWMLEANPLSCRSASPEWQNHFATLGFCPTKAIPPQGVAYQDALDSKRRSPHAVAVPLQNYYTIGCAIFTCQNLSLSLNPPPRKRLCRKTPSLKTQKCTNEAKH